MRRGDTVLVETTSGYRSGVVNYVRMGPPTYSTIEAVSVLLDDKTHKENYSGSLFAAEKVRLLKEAAVDEQEET